MLRIQVQGPKKLGCLKRTTRTHATEHAKVTQLLTNSRRSYGCEKRNPSLRATSTVPGSEHKHEQFSSGSDQHRPGPARRGHQGFLSSDLSPKAVQTLPGYPLPQKLSQTSA